MTDKNRVYDLEVMDLPSLRLVPREMLLSDPDAQHTAGHKLLKIDPEMESTVKRLIAHLKDEKFWREDFSHQG